MAHKVRPPIKQFGKAVKNQDGSTRYDHGEKEQEFSALSIEGQQFKPDKEGCFTVPDALATRLYAEGWQAAGAVDEEKPAADDKKADKKDDPKKSA